MSSVGIVIIPIIIVSSSAIVAQDRSPELPRFHEDELPRPGELSFLGESRTCEVTFRTRDHGRGRVYYVEQVDESALETCCPELTAWSSTLRVMATSIGVVLLFLIALWYARRPSSSPGVQVEEPLYLGYPTAGIPNRLRRGPRQRALAILGEI